MTTIYTIGHSNHRWEPFLALLRANDIETLVDVRSRPVSRWAAFANIRALPGLLEREGIRHVFMGDSLGGKPADKELHDDNGAPDYDKMASQPAFQKGIEELIGVAADSRVALMCAEEDPGACHRSLLIGPAIEESGAALVHIRRT